MYAEVPTARIHQPCSSSWRTIRDLCVSIESTASPLEKLLCCCEPCACLTARCASRHTLQSRPCPVPARPAAASRALLPSVCRHGCAWSASWRPWSSRRRFAGRTSRRMCPATGCRWRGTTAARGQPWAVRSTTFVHVSTGHAPPVERWLASRDCVTARLQPSPTRVAAYLCAMMQRNRGIAVRGSRKKDALAASLSASSVPRIARQADAHVPRPAGFPSRFQSPICTTQ